jgi:hypothetical protein
MSATDGTTVALLAQTSKYSPENAVSKVSSLPLLGWSAKAEVLGCVGQVTLIQCFQNTQIETVDITYYFPLNEGSSVCGFQLERESGAAINGVAKEKAQALQEFREAKTRGQTAALLEYDRPDIFKLSLGILGPKEHVKISITYLSILNAEDDDLCFVFPTSIAPLYSPDSTFRQNQSTPVIFEGMQLEVSFQMCSLITSLTSPSHKSEANIDIHVSGTTATFKITGSSQRGDIILLCKEEKAYEPRALLEIGPDGSMAGLVMLSPKIDPQLMMQPPPPRDFFFVVDCSGSMKGIKIQQASSHTHLAFSLFQSCSG